MNEWIDELSDLTAASEPCVLVTVAGIRGSAPREVGAKMIVTAKETIGTIGGGQLEYQATRIACDMLDLEERPRLRKFPLGSSVGQCCGGVVDILFEPLASGLPSWLSDVRALHGQREPAVLATPLEGDGFKAVITANNVFCTDPERLTDRVLNASRVGIETRRIAYREEDWLLELIVGSNFNIAVFGAGHVGTAVVRSLSALDCNIRWIDSRRNVFRKTPANVRAIEAPDPACEVGAMPPGSCYLIMTHSHALDYDICNRVLMRNDAAYCGLIGSVSKRRRFEKRYRSEGMPQHLLDNLVCPIGVDGISGKKPAEIAVAASADVLRAFERGQSQRDITYPDNVHPLNHRS